MFLRPRLKPKKYLFLLRATRFPIIPGVIVLLFVIAAVFGQSMAPYPASQLDLGAKFRPPFFQGKGSRAHFLGTDMLGRDMLSRIIVGARPSFIVAMVVVCLGGLGGTALGIIAGYYGGKLGEVLMRVADTTIAFPIILLAMLLAILLKPSILIVVISISAIIWARYARVIRGEVLSLKERDFVALARVAGASGARIMIRHIFPNIVPTMLVMLTLQVGYVIIVESALSFLGAGIPPPTPVWGSLIARGRNYLTIAWWIPFFPGLALVLICLSFNMLGDWLREVLDPKLRQAVRVDERELVVR
jgi:peptide/nickel transport system permease protein